MKTKLGLLAVTGLVALAASVTAAAAADRAFTVATWGGAYTKNQRTAVVDPFSTASGTTVLDAPYTGGLGEVRTMSETGNPTWDVVQMGGPEAISGCLEGLLEPLDAGRLENAKDLGAVGVTECGAGAIAWSMVIAYNTKLTGDQPKTWSDFWDVKKYPGKRGFRRGPQYALEAALIADGVAYDKIYDVLSTPEGVDRAFKKLDKIKDHVQWWEKGAQPPELLANENLVMSTSYVGRILAAVKEGAPLAIGWDEAFFSVDYWVVVKDSPNIETAYNFLNFATKPKPQADFARLQAVAPVNMKSAVLLSADDLAKIPAGDNLNNQIPFSDAFWIDQLESLTNRFNTWLAQ